MHEHDLRWAATPQGLVRSTPWGWRSACVCGWAQPGPAEGTRKQGMDAWAEHRRTSTLGKTVTLPRGIVVTDVGPAIVNGAPCEGVRRCAADDGRLTVVLDRVVRELPETVRRASFDRRPGDRAA